MSAYTYEILRSTSIMVIHVQIEDIIVTNVQPKRTENLWARKQI